MKKPIKRRLQFDHWLSKSLNYQPAQTIKELTAAYTLAYFIYLKCGYMDPNPAKMRLSHLNALPEAITFVAKKKNKIISTVNIIPDSPCGLPAEQCFPQEIAYLRQKSAFIVEVGGFASRIVNQSNILHLMKTLILYAELNLSAHHLLICVHPKHLSFYKTYLKFEQLGEQQNFRLVKNNPAVLLYLNLNRYRRLWYEEGELYGESESVYDFVFVKDHKNIHLPAGKGPLQIWDERKLHYFFLERTSLFADLTPQLREVFVNQYGYRLLNASLAERNHGGNLDLEFTKRTA